ncbi:hypothetical protein [Schleiferilactobacillus perolens]|jgi:hypothetical protein|uniref:hypothetical protein n=1 Tax=Schleiferilactobacillus perolens TaxID=100468 RepID=UPI0023532DF9|nr:hypothetical protein [Schleiferilactobacillus perolens]MCI2170986.1 hypothetical protein [Schleiferilactobacillus perolens]
MDKKNPLWLEFDQLQGQVSEIGDLLQVLNDYIGTLYEYNVRAQERTPDSETLVLAEVARNASTYTTLMHVLIGMLGDYQTDTQALIKQAAQQARSITKP